MYTGLTPRQVKLLIDFVDFTKAEDFAFDYSIDTRYEEEHENLINELQRVNDYQDLAEDCENYARQYILDCLMDSIYNN